MEALYTLICLYCFVCYLPATKLRILQIKVIIQILLESPDIRIFPNIVLPFFSQTDRTRSQDCTAGKPCLILPRSGGFSAA
jgi:hypothetical protein